MSSMTVNGEPIRYRLDPATPLLSALREASNLTGTKFGCDSGECGACTVIVDGRATMSCSVTIADLEGAQVTTIEGLAGPHGRLHPLQQAFIDHDAFQCGYCTSGQIMAGVACIAEGRAGSVEQIREAMSGNLCRCGAYTNIVAAVQDAAARQD